MFRAYYALTKPGIVYGNVFTVIAGFLFASDLRYLPWSLLSVSFGMALTIAGSCVFNNVLDRDIDARMDRTKGRAVVTGVISIPRALVFASVLLLAGISVLTLHTNALTAAIALFGAVSYVVIYGYAKRTTRFGTLVGSIAGAVPILAGYTAYTNSVDAIGIVLFLVLVLWQMPHFYAIAIYRLQDYRAAGIPVLPAIIGVNRTKTAIIAYIVVFLGAELTLFMLGALGYTYLVLVSGYGIAWFVRALRGVQATDDVQWARGVFKFSIQVLLAFSIGIAFGTLFL